MAASVLEVAFPEHTWSCVCDIYSDWEILRRNDNKNSTWARTHRERPSHESDFSQPGIVVLFLQTTWGLSPIYISPLVQDTTPFSQRHIRLDVNAFRAILINLLQTRSIGDTKRTVICWKMPLVMRMPNRVKCRGQLPYHVSSWHHTNRRNWLLLINVLCWDQILAPSHPPPPPSSLS